MDVGADGSGLQRREEVFRLGVDDDLGSKGIKCPLLGCPFPARAGRAEFGVDEGGKRVLPGPGGDPGVARGEIHFAQLTAQSWMSLRFVLGLDELLGFAPIPRVKAGVVECLVVEAVENTAPAEEAPGRV